MDSSGLAKLLIPNEVGADVVRTHLHRTNRPTTSIVTYAECRAALAAAVRSGRMDAPQCRQAVINLDSMWLSLFRIFVDESIIRLAGSLVDRRKLRGFDAIHLASALGLGADTVMVSWDKDLTKAAHDEGLITIPT